QAGLFDALTPAEPAAPVGSTVTSVPQLDELVEKIRAHGSFAFNVQATGVLPMRAELVGVGLAAGEDAAYVPLGHAAGEQLSPEEALARLRPLFEDASLPKRAHNAKFHMV